MVGSEIKTQFENLVDDSLDSDFSYQLMNISLNDIYGERDWEFLKKVDVTKSNAIGDTYTTTKALPTDFVGPLLVQLADSLEPVNLIPFTSKEFYKDTSGLYFLDLVNDTYALTGTTAETKVINFFYIYGPDDVTSSTSPVIPGRFHPIVAYYMAMNFFNVDYDNVTLSGKIGDKNFAIFSRLKSNMAMWDAKIKAMSLRVNTQA